MCATEVFSSALLISTPGFNPWAALHRMSFYLKQTVRNTCMMCTRYTYAHESQRYILHCVSQIHKETKTTCGCNTKTSVFRRVSCIRPFVCLLIATFVSRLCSCPGCCFSGGSPGKLDSVTLICLDWTEVTIVGQHVPRQAFYPTLTNTKKDTHALSFCVFAEFTVSFLQYDFALFFI